MAAMGEQTSFCARGIPATSFCTYRRRIWEFCKFLHVTCNSFVRNHRQFYPVFSLIFKQLVYAILLLFHFNDSCTDHYLPG